MADNPSAREPLPPLTSNNTGRAKPHPNRGHLHDSTASRKTAGERRTGEAGARPRLAPLTTSWTPGPCAGHHGVNCRLSHPTATPRVTPSADPADTTDPTAVTAPRPLPEYLVPIVAQLMTGATDVTASQRLGMSPRTFSRRVSELLDYLGVMSRFQAGVAAVNHGWLVPQRQHPPVRKH